MYTPTKIANYFISEHPDGQLTPMKVIKLTYIAYGWYLAIKDNKERLVDERPLAWTLGPVFPSLYSNLKGYGGSIITKKISNPVKEKDISDSDKRFLEKIWSIYGRYDGIYLSALTHKDGTPWKKYYVPGCNHVIEDEEIYNHYKAMIQIPADV